MEKKKSQTGSTIKEAFLKWSGLFFVIVAALILYLVVTNIKVITEIVGSYMVILRPVVYGCVIAYILNPLMKIYQEVLIKGFTKKDGTISEKIMGIINGVSIVLSLVSGILIIIVLSWMIIPQLLDSITSLINNLPEKANYYYNQLNESIRNNKFLASKMQDMALNITDYLDDKVNTELLPWLQSDLLPSVNSIAMEFANGVMSVLNLLYNLFIGIIVAIYILASKNTFSAQAKKIVYGLFHKEHGDMIIHYVNISNKMFSGFITGKIVDSTIVGIICFILMSVFRLPYALLISVIVGVTNIIPVFGPYIGLVPSAFLILLVNPMQALYFIILIAVLQQLDGNIIGPAILGESTGLSAFWVLFSILLFGGLWGIIGMIVGVPLFAVIYRIITDFINWRLQGKDLSTETEAYRNLKAIEMDGENMPVYVKYTQEELRENQRKKQKKREMLLNKYKNKGKTKKQEEQQEEKKG